ncbi:MAG: hypothetical protein U9N80_02985 [Chloroflexota bacterium]|nr:hypothetical protein [Chloroflexota bacterium]
MKKRNDYFVLEYSPSQRAWHIEHIEDLIQANLLTYIDKSEPRDFMLMSIARTHEELILLHEEITKIYKKIHPAEDADDSPMKKKSLVDRIRQLFTPRKISGP